MENKIDKSVFWRYIYKKKKWRKATVWPNLGDKDNGFKGQACDDLLDGNNGIFL